MDTLDNTLWQMSWERQRVAAILSHQNLKTSKGVGFGQRLLHCRGLQLFLLFWRDHGGGHLLRGRLQKEVEEDDGIQALSLEGGWVSTVTTQGAVFKASLAFSGSNRAGNKKWSHHEVLLYICRNITDDILPHLYQE